MSCEEHGGELDLEKGVFLRRREADSGNNSLQSSTGTASSKLSQPRECNSFLEEDEADYEEERPSPEVRIKRPAANTNIIEVRYRGELPDMSIISLSYTTFSCRTELSGRSSKANKWRPGEKAESPREPPPDHQCVEEHKVNSPSTL